MKTQKQHIYHGPALTQIVEHESFKALNRASEKRGHYLVNADREVFVKYRTNETSPWQFVFGREEVNSIQHAIKGKNRIFVCLVCGPATVCGLTVDEVRNLIDLARSDQENQSIIVSIPPGGSCHVNGSAGKLPKTVPHNSFPGRLFE